MNESLPKGAFLLSIDTELAWGSVHSGAFESRMGHYQRTRDAISRLLALQEQYEIHATWAVVGHLFLDQCQAVDGVKHPEIVRPEYPWFEGDWFDADPCTDVEEDPFWYGPDIIKQIQQCKVAQEIGCHGFAHTIIGDPACRSESFDSEIKACISQAEKWGVQLKSFVFPRNSVGHLGVLASNGFTSYRGTTHAWHSGLPGSFQRVTRLIDRMLPTAPSTTMPRFSGELWDIPASYFYPHRDGWTKLIPPGISVRKAKLGLNAAAEERSIFHLWFHPFNLASDVDVLIQGLEKVFQHVCRLREAGRLSNPTMADLSESLEQTRKEVTA